MNNFNKLLVLCIFFACGNLQAQTTVHVNKTELNNHQKIKRELRQVVRNNPECQEIGDFYFSIGDKNGMLVTGKVGKKFDAGTEVKYASASKLLFATQALEMKRWVSPSLVDALRFTSGYDAKKRLGCGLWETAQSCFNKKGHKQIRRRSFGKFSYAPGHMLKAAVKDLGMGKLNHNGFTRSLKQHLGRDLNMEFGPLNPAGGIRGDAISYEKVLMGIVSGRYKMSRYLGSYQVCASSKNCPSNVVYSPVKEKVNYSLGHWVEIENGQTAAYSSAGAFGFYPWIDVSKKYFGVISRQGGGRAGLESMQCGQKIRQAFVNVESKSFPFGGPYKGCPGKHAGCCTPNK